MAKHAKNNGAAGVPSKGGNGYVYPDGRRYGATYGSPAGQPVEQPTQVYSPIAQNQVAQIQEAQNQGAYKQNNYANAGNYNAAYSQSFQKKKKGNRVLKGIAAFLAILVLLVGGGLAFFVMQADRGLGYEDANYASGILERLSAQADNDVFYVLVIGSDQVGSSSVNARSRSDVLMLARVDIRNNTVTLVSVPRDTAWQQPSGEYYKINEAYYLGGANSSLDAVEALTGVEINHVVEVHLDRLADFIDSMGGLEYDVPVTIHHVDEAAGEDFYIEAGKQLLSGKEATILMRARHDYGQDQDANRQNTIRGVVAAVYHQAFSKSAIELPGTLINATQCIDTDMNSAQLFFTATGLGSGAKFYSASGPTNGGPDPGNDGRWLCYLDPDGWARLMAAVDAGEDPATISYENDTVYLPSTGEPIYE